MKTSEQKLASFIHTIFGTGGFHNPNTPENSLFFRKVRTITTDADGKTFSFCRFADDNTRKDVIPIAKHGDHFLCMADFRDGKGMKMHRGEIRLKHNIFEFYDAIPCNDEEEFARICGWKEEED